MRVPGPVGVLLLLYCALLWVHAAAVAQTPRPAFDVATVKPAPPGTDPSTGSWSLPGNGRFSATHVSLALLLQLAYGVIDSQISRKPEWLETSLYDVVAKPEEGILLTRDELKLRLQNLLQQRFHLTAHTEMGSERGYVLVVAKGGPHLTPTKGDHFAGFRINVSPGQMRGANWSMPQMARYLTSAAGFPVVDGTGITGSYDVGFSYEAKPDADSALPPLDVALERATGLLLKPGRVPVERLVIDSVERVPTQD